MSLYPPLLEATRCRGDRGCPSRMHCRRFLEQPGTPIYAAWEARRAGQPHCDGYQPVPPVSQLHRTEAS